MNSFKSLMQKAEENQNHYEKKHLNNINRQLEHDERRKKIENEKIKRKEEAYNNFKKIAKSLPSDLQKNRDGRERSNSISRNSRDESSISKKNDIFNLKIRKTSSNNHNNDNHKINHERQKKLSNSSLTQSKKRFSFKDLMEIAKHNDVSKPVINNSSDDFREAKKALKNSSGRKKYKDDFDEDDSDEGNRRISKKKISKKEIREKPEIKKSKKELLNEQMERRKKEREMNRKAYDGSKDRVAQERIKLLKSRGIRAPVTSKISQDVTEMVKRMEKINNSNNNSNNNNNNNSNNKSQSKESIHRPSSDLHESRSKSNSRYSDYDSDRDYKKHSRYDEESDDYDSEYEYERRRKLSNGNTKKIKKVKGMNEDYENNDEDYVRKTIREIFGYNRDRYRDEDDIDDMEVGYSDVKREEARSLRIAKREDEEEEELERQRLERAKRRRRRD